MTANRDRIEFYLVGQGGYIASTESSHAPDRGDKVNIRSFNYVVVGRSYTVDHAAEFHLTSVVCVITLEPAAP